MEKLLLVLICILGVVIMVKGFVSRFQYTKNQHITLDLSPFSAPEEPHGLTGQRDTDGIPHQVVDYSVADGYIHEERMPLAPAIC